MKKPELTILSLRLAKKSGGQTSFPLKTPKGIKASLVLTIINESSKNKIISLISNFRFVHLYSYIRKYSYFVKP